MSHTRATSEALAAGLPGAELVEPPWGDDEWNERRAAVEEVGSLFVRWPLLVPQLVDWADRTIGRWRSDHDHHDGAAHPRRSLVRRSRRGRHRTTSLSDADLRARDQRALRGVRAADLRGRRADPEDAGRVQQRVRTAQGPPEQGDAPRRGRRPARRHRDPPRAERAGQRTWSTVRLLSQWLPWHFDHCYNDAAQPRRRAARRRDPTRGRPDRLRRRHRAVQRDLARGARPDRGRDGDLRDGRDHGEPPVRPAGRASSRSSRRPGRRR